MASPYLPPPRWLLGLNRLLVALRLTDAIRVRGRRTGQVRELAVNVLEHGGRRYLVAPRGDTEWVRNVRAVGGAEVRHRGRWRPVKVRELPVAERQPVIDDYVARWGWQAADQFRALPRPEQHPVFELLPP